MTRRSLAGHTVEIGLFSRQAERIDATTEASNTCGASIGAARRRKSSRGPLNEM